MLEYQISLFGEAPPNTRTNDAPTSVAAAKKVEWTITLMQQSVLQHIAQMQPVTAAEIEELPVFSKLAPSTVRKRISELKHLGIITAVDRAVYITKSGRRTLGEAYVLSEAAR